jgi:ureidoacrylate peracid hydrolase
MARYDDLHAHPDGYRADPATAALVTVDYQIAFGELEPVPGAQAALDSYRRLAAAWRRAGGLVIHLHTTFTGRAEAGLLNDFAPGVVDALQEGQPNSEFFPGVVEEGDLLVRKIRFSGVLGSNLLEILRGRQLDTAIVCGLTTPICVQSTVDALQMSDIHVILAADACASQALGEVSAAEAHRVAVERMRYVMARVADSATLIDEFSTKAKNAVTPK